MYQNPSPPPGYKCTNPPDFEFIKIHDENEIDFELLKKLGVFDMPDLSRYIDMELNYNLDKDEDTQIVPVKAKEKNVAIITVDDDETDDDDFIPVHKVKKDKDDRKEKKHRERKTREDRDNKPKKSKIEGFEKYSKKKKERHQSDEEDEEDERRKRDRKQRSSSTTDDSDEDYKIKREYDDHPIKQESFNGVFYCDLCKLTLNSQATFESHMTGKRHKKNYDAKHVDEALEKTYVAVQLASKYPRPLPGYRRIEDSCYAKIQKIVDKKLETTLGLHKVIEIHSPTQTSYYCSLCDAPCGLSSILPHLKGFKHQLNCLKHYDKNFYEVVNSKPKFIVENKVKDRLRLLEKKLGKSYLTVEKDIPDRDNYDSRPCISSTRPRDLRDQPSTSKQDADFTEIFISCSQPDPSKSGFYCKICDSHSNNQAMWDAHINGKRHIANVKRGPGAAPSKCKNIPAPPGTIPRLYAQLNDVYEPIVGLNQIREIVRQDIDTVSYTCFLCAGCHGESDIVDHIISRRHREKYLEKIRHPDLELLNGIQMHNQGMVYNLIIDMCRRVEEEEGRGKPEVYYAKNSLVKM